jgi:hypothetical protein
MENLLYFPYINIPKTKWTLRALIYYDNVGCIVPQRYFYNPEDYDQHMLQLVQSELVIPVNPMDELDRPFDSMEPFIRYIERKNNLRKRRDAFHFKNRRSRVHREKLNPKKSLIHSDKLDGEILYRLEHLGLARQEDRQWFEVEKKTAKELMIFLATVVANKINYLPTTDKFNKRFTLKNKSKKIFKSKKNEIKKRELILERLLPMPEDIELTKLRKFKDNHQDLLLQFRNKVEGLVFNPQIEEDTPLFDSTLEELEQRKDEIAARMDEGKFGRLFYGTACGIVGAGIGMAAADTTGAIIGGLPSFANAIHEAITLANPTNEVDYTGMKYLALIDKKLR